MLKTVDLTVYLAYQVHWESVSKHMNVSRTTNSHSTKLKPWLMSCKCLINSSLWYLTQPWSLTMWPWSCNLTQHKRVTVMCYAAELHYHVTCPSVHSPGACYSPITPLFKFCFLCLSFLSFPCCSCCPTCPSLTYSSLVSSVHFFCISFHCF